MTGLNHTVTDPETDGYVKCTAMGKHLDVICYFNYRNYSLVLDK